MEFERPDLLLYERKIQGARKLLPLREAIARSGRSLLVVADDLPAESGIRTEMCSYILL